LFSTPNLHGEAGNRIVSGGFNDRRKNMRYRAA
jgi:hypothetical protein